MEIRSLIDAKQFNEQRFTKIDIIKTRKSVAFLLNFLPDQEMKQHSHPGRELYLHVLAGTGLLLIDDEENQVSKDDVIYCHAEEEVGFINTGEDNVSIYAVMTKIT